MAMYVVGYLDQWQDLRTEDFPFFVSDQVYQLGQVQRPGRVAHDQKSLHVLTSWQLAV